MVSASIHATILSSFFTMAVFLAFSILVHDIVQVLLLFYLESLISPLEHLTVLTISSLNVHILWSFSESHKDIRFACFLYWCSKSHFLPLERSYVLQSDASHVLNMLNDTKTLFYFVLVLSDEVMVECAQIRFF